MIKKNYKKWLIALGMIILSVISYHQYQEKKMYEAYISMDVSNDMQTLAVAIIRSEELYGEILAKKSITGYQADRLKYDHYDILEVSQKYGNLASTFGRVDHGILQNATANHAQNVGGFFSEMIGSEYDAIDVTDDVILELNDEEEEKMIQLQELNSLWLDSILQHVEGVTDDNGEIKFDGEAYRNHYGDYSLSDDFWVYFVMDLDEHTSQFLRENSQFR